ncbi:MAG TPA: T9SS type A sorting domain-containing protein [Candidatus Cloacimonetes bacterium]|nr:T9SS type A sorting domain-containing protein [Candidatus Cloacimonadota bacterium]
MKKIVFMTMLILSITLAYTATYTVGPNHDFETIQDAIDYASNGDNISVFPYPFDDYDAIDFLTKQLNIYANGNVTIDGGVSSIVVDMDEADYATIDGFNITGSGDYGVYVNDTNSVDVEDNEIENVDTGVYVKNSVAFDLENNEIHDTETGIHIDKTGYVSNSANLDWNKVYDNDVGLQIDNSYYSTHSVTISGILIYDNTYEGISFGGTQAITLNMYHSTITGNDDGIEFQSNSTATIINSNIYGNTSDSFTGSPISLTVTYSCIEDGYSGTGNTDEDPYFCMDTGYEYRLMEGSPCIDGGDPYEQDSDGTRLDMGYYKTLFDIKPLEGDHSNWVSFPRLDRDDNDPVNAPELLEEMIPMPDDLTLQEYLSQLTYDGTWSNEDYEVASSKGYILDIEDNGDFILPEEGSRLAEDWTITLYEGIENWIGYWLPLTQALEDAIDKDTLDYITSIEAENWYAYQEDGKWMGWGTEDPTFVYGKGYIIEVEEDITLAWEKGGRSKRFIPEKAEYFTFDDKSRYEMIDIESVEGGENLLEIGVFQDEVCVGASKVDGFPIHIMAYTDAVNRSDELSFVLYSGRSELQTIKTVLKYNFKTGEYERTIMHPFESKFSLIKLESNGDDLTDDSYPIKLANYPNPFTGLTTISLSLPEDSKAELSIYNLKGQKVKTLSSGDMSKGDQQITWDGTNDNSKPVSSGIYMYRLDIPNKSVSRKLLLMR